MRLLVARFRSGAELLERTLKRENGGLFLPTRRVIEPGEPVLVDVRLAELRDHLLVRGVVVERQRGRRSGGVRAGLFVEFLASEAGKRDHLLALAQGQVAAGAAGQRRHRRLPIELRVDWRVPNQTERHISLVDDIGIGGAFLRTRELPEAGTPVVIELRPPGANTPQPIEGRVAWRRSTPGHEGVGVEFRCRDIGGMRRLRELVRRIERHEVAASSQLR